MVHFHINSLKKNTIDLNHFGIRNCKMIEALISGNRSWATLPKVNQVVLHIWKSKPKVNLPKVIEFLGPWVRGPLGPWVPDSPSPWAPGLWVLGPEVFGSWVLGSPGPWVPGSLGPWLPGSLEGSPYKERNERVVQTPAGAVKSVVPSRF
jgi:hypothetical protein